MALPPLHRILCAAAVLAGVSAQVSFADPWSRIDVRTERSYWLSATGSGSKVKRLGETTPVDLPSGGMLLEAGMSYLVSYRGDFAALTISSVSFDSSKKPFQDKNKPSMTVSIGMGTGSARTVTTVFNLSKDSKSRYPYFTTVGVDPSALNAVTEDKKDSSKRVFLAIGVGRALSAWTPGQGGSDQVEGSSSDSGSAPQE